MVPVSLREIAAATGGRLINCENPGNFTVSAVSTDSRTIQENSLFVAIRGENFDGHDFAEKAVQNGAVAVMCQREPQVVNVPAVLVEDTTKALLDLAGFYRSRFDIPVVGITGSVGKTTTKELVACVLQKGFNTLKTKANFNNHIGMPMTLLGLGPEVTAAVVEMGMNHFGEIERLSKAAKPNIGVITVIGMSHIEYLGSKENIMKAKLEILGGMDKTGVLVLNGDDPLLWRLKGKLPVKTVYFGIENEEAEFRAYDISQNDSGLSFGIQSGGLSAKAALPLCGRHNVYNALAAFAVGSLLRISPEDCAQGLSDYTDLPMRQRCYETGGLYIIEDCYNAGPDSMRAALDMLKSANNYNRRIAVLGDMLELGGYSEKAHLEIGIKAAASADLLFIIGKFSDAYRKGALEGGMKPESIFCFDSPQSLVRGLLGEVKEGDALLFKASRGLKLEKVLEEMLKGWSGR